MSLYRSVLENEQLRAVFIPELGGKLVSLVRLASGTEFLLQPPERDYRPAVYGEPFEEFDTSGFDECFPTIAPCGGLPDHGELWSVPWEGDARAMQVSGRARSYRFARGARLEGSSLWLDYELENTGGAPFDYLWSAHPLLAVEPGAQILLPWETRELMVEWSLDERLGRRGERVDWRPITAVQPPEAGFADKLFTARLSRGFCALYRPLSDESIAFRFDEKAIPYAGLWLCQGGWPITREAKHFTVALQPSTARTDSLELAAERAEARLLGPTQIIRWSLQVEIGPGQPA